MKVTIHSRIALISFLILTVFLANQTKAQWIMTNSPKTDISSIVVSGKNIFAGSSRNGIFLTSDDGANWTQVNNGLSDTIISCMNKYIDKNGDTTIFEGSDGVYISNNNGKSWEPTWLNFEGIPAITVSDTNIYAGTNGGVYRSTDGGVTWDWTYLPSAWQVNTIAVQANNNILVGSWGGVFKSSDYTNWTTINNNLSDSMVNTIAIDGNNIFVGTEGVVYGKEGGVFLSTNNGTSWNKMNNGLTDSVIHTLIIDGTNIFAGTDEGIFLSKNNGTSWTEINDGLRDSTIVTSLAISGTEIFAGTRGKGVWKRPLQEVTSVKNFPLKPPLSYTLQQNYPNPFNPSTTINYSLLKASNVKIEIFNMLGQRVAILVNKTKQAGNYNVKWNAEEFASGIYLYRLEAVSLNGKSNFVEAKKMILIK
jgi:photosystem II stability/assembly factor-like uncharacterized protein